MTGRLLRSKGRKTVLIDVFLDYAVYDAFKGFMAEHKLDESSALSVIIERGMQNYWVQEFKQIRGSGEYFEALLKQYEKDNKDLEALEKENEQMRILLAELEMTEQSHSS